MREDETDMNDKSASSRSGVYGLVGAGAAAVALIAAGVFFSTREVARLSDEDVGDVATSAGPSVVGTTELPDTPPANAPDNAQAPETGEQVAASEVATEASPRAAEDADAPAPRVDEVRVDTSGMLVVAGRAEPGARVDVLVDDEVVASVDADASGSFAALGTLSASDAARRLTLRAGGDDKAITSNEEIILAPVTGPEPALTAETEAAEETPAASETVDAAAADVAEDVTDTNIATSAAGSQDNTAPEDHAAPERVAEAAPEAEPTTPQSKAAEADAGTEFAVLRSDEVGVTLVTPQAPAQSVVLDTIGYNDAGDVQLSGRAEESSVEIRAYLNNRAIARLPVDDTGAWRGEVPEIDSGIYTLRVDALDADGTVVSRIETPFKREAPAVLAAAAGGPDGPARAITVQAGDTLWAIARDRYGEGLLYVQVFEANRTAIRDPDLIYPGQVFDLPSE